MRKCPAAVRLFSDFGMKISNIGSKKRKIVLDFCGVLLYDTHRKDVEFAIFLCCLKERLSYSQKGGSP